MMFVVIIISQEIECIRNRMKESGLNHGIPNMEPQLSSSGNRFLEVYRMQTDRLLQMLELPHIWTIPATASNISLLSNQEIMDSNVRSLEVHPQIKRSRLVDDPNELSISDNDDDDDNINQKEGELGDNNFMKEIVMDNNNNIWTNAIHSLSQLSKEEHNNSMKQSIANEFIPFSQPLCFDCSDDTVYKSTLGLPPPVQSSVNDYEDGHRSASKSVDTNAIDIDDL